MNNRSKTNVWEELGKMLLTNSKENQSYSIQ